MKKAMRIIKNEEIKDKIIDELIAKTCLMAGLTIKQLKKNNKDFIRIIYR